MAPEGAVQAERHKPVVPLAEARAARWVPPVVRPAEAPELEAPREMAKQALWEWPVQAGRLVAAEVERSEPGVVPLERGVAPLEPGVAPLEAPEVPLGARSAVGVRVRAVLLVKVEPSAAAEEVAAPPARTSTLIS